MLDARTIEQTIRQARVDSGLKQSQLASLAGVSERTLISVEMGTAPGIGMGKLASILDVLGLDLKVVPAVQTENNHDLDETLYSEAFDAAVTQYSFIHTNTTDNQRGSECAR